MNTYAQGYIAAIGGGAESDTPGSWSERPYRWIVERAGGRAVAILSTADETDYLPSYFVALGAERAFNLRVDTREAADGDAVYEAVSSAGAVFVKGGSQWDYIRLWSGTRLARAIAEVYASGGVVAGTSAGMAVLGATIYDSREGSVYPEEALRDPYDERITFTTGFLGFVPRALFDSHFTERGRIARLAAFVARIETERPGAGVAGIGVDDNTALVVSPDMRAEVMGQGAVTIVRATPESELRIAPGRAPVATNLALDSLTEGFVYDLGERRVVTAPATAGRGTEPRERGPYVEVAIDGSERKAGKLGEVALGRETKDSQALGLGKLVEKRGKRKIPGAAVVTRAYADVGYIENRVGGLVWLLARNPGVTGLLVDAGAEARVDATGRVTFAGGEAAPATLVFETRAVEWWGFSRWVLSDRAKGPRQSVALTGARLHLLAPGWRYDAASGTVSRAE